MKPKYFFILFGLTLSLLFSSGQIENPDTHLRLAQTRLFMQNCDFELNDNTGEIAHGNIAINKKGERHMVYNPGQSLIFTPIYVLGNILFEKEHQSYYFSAFIVSFLNFFIHAFTAFILFKIALTLGSSKRNAFIMSVLFGLTSYSFIFAQSTYEHHFESLFVLLSIYQVLNDNSKNFALKAGLILTLGLIFRSSVVLAVPGIFLLLKTNYSRIKFILGLSLGMIIVLFYNYYRFQSVFETGYSIAWSLAHTKNIVFWSIQRIPEGIIGLLFSPGKGILFFSFTFLFGIFGMKEFYLKNRRLSLCILFMISNYLILFSMNFAWHGSVWSFGPRYILPIVPLLYLPVIYLKSMKWMNLILITFFIFQCTLLTVNYKRNVLSQHINSEGVSDLEYAFNINNEPHYVQINQLLKIFPKNQEKLKNLQPKEPWRREIRTGTNNEVLNSSIEKTSVNFWWIRIFHWNTSVFTKVISITLLMLCLFTSGKLIHYYRNEFK